MNAPNVVKSKHNVPGQYLGYALQPLRLFFHLLTAPKGASVSLEHVEDVAVHYADGQVLLEQTKSALAHNPLSDWSVDLWKSIGNWIDDIESGRTVLAKTRFQLYVTPSYSGTLSAALSRASTPDEVDQLVAFITKGMRAKKSALCMPHVAKFLNLDATKRYELVRRIGIISEDDDPTEPMRQFLRATIDEALIDALCAIGIGIAKDEADRLIRQGKVALLSCDDFRKQFQAFVKKNNMPGLLNSLTPVPTVGEVESLLAKRPDFVVQLDFIDLSSEQKLNAASDFLQTSNDKVMWGALGRVFENSYDDLERDLTRQHLAIQGEVSDAHSDKVEVVQGRLIYNRCAQVTAPLEGNKVPGHFIAGTFNSLADRRHLGWHPRYLELLDEESDK
ncbi:ABC-three component system protein [Pseudoduganella sp. RAF53_2]|uniref:ABC-three component system protein n=1 Tax=unclassified Pseudoduganella TaxID=2637179 RepID=UPI003F9DDB05